MKYGKRKSLTDDERASLSRARNREHARSTRMRRKVNTTCCSLFVDFVHCLRLCQVFEDVLQNQLKKISVSVQACLSPERQGVYLQRRELRAKNFITFCSLLVSLYPLTHPLTPYHVILPIHSSWLSSIIHHVMLSDVKQHYLRLRVDTLQQFKYAAIRLL